MPPEFSDEATGLETPNGATRREPRPDIGEATVEGALVVGRSPSEAAMGGSTIPNPQPQIRKIPPREVEPLDLAEMSRGAVLKRAVPVVAGLAALAAVVWLVRRG